MEISNLQGGVKLHNGVVMPYFGLGVFQTNSGEEVIEAVKAALLHGYRHIDTAAIYKNEAGVGEGIRKSGIAREEVFVVSKVWNKDQGYETTIDAFHQSLEKLKMEYLDLYLIHWPVTGKFNDTWRALETLYSSGKVRAIGVSNFLQHHLEKLLLTCDVIPMVNQMEFHPFLLQQPLLNYCRDHEIQYEAWAPLMRGKVFEIDLFNELARKYNKTEVQIVLRWNLQKDVVTIPKSARKDRIISNSEIFDFELSTEDMSKIDSLDCHERLGPDPDNFNF